jgi:hypothetical protein
MLCGSFVSQLNMRSHTGGLMSLGKVLFTQYQRDKNGTLESPQRRN